MKILAFGDIHFHHTHRFSHITPEGFTVRELEHIQCADVINNICKEENIDRIVFLGDLYSVVGDSLSGQTQAAVCTFIEKISKDRQVDLLVGNHDFCTHTNGQSIHKLIPFKNWKNITVYDNPKVVDDFVYMPYCDSDNFAETFLSKIQDKQNKIIFSHLEICGFNFVGGIKTSHGVSIPLLSQFKMTLQGHYHTGGSLADKIQVAGSTQRLSFKDPGRARKNILIYDTDTNTVTRKSFNCPDWLVFDDDNLDDILRADNNNYVKLDLSTDFLLTPEIKEKISQMKGADIHIDIKRLSLDRNKSVDVQSEDEIEVITQFINKSTSDEEEKKALISEGVRLIERVKSA